MRDGVAVASFSPTIDAPRPRGAGRKPQTRRWQSCAFVFPEREGVDFGTDIMDAQADRLAGRLYIPISTVKTHTG